MRKNMQVNCPQQSLQARNIGGWGHFLSLENYLQNYKVLGLTHFTLRPLPSPLIRILRIGECLYMYLGCGISLGLPLSKTMLCVCLCL